MEDSRREEESRQQEILRGKEELAAAERELENLPPAQPTDEHFVSYTFNIQNLLILNS